MNEILEFLVRRGTSVLFAAVFVEQMGVPLPAAPWLMAAGALAGAGKMNWAVALSAATFAALLADLIWFYLGRHRGQRVLNLLCRISLEPDSCVRRTENLFTRYGIILYCSCPNEASSARAALQLHRKGISRVRPLLGGIVAWRDRNYPMELRAIGVTSAEFLFVESGTPPADPISRNAENRSHYRINNQDNDVLKIA